MKSRIFALALVAATIPATAQAMTFAAIALSARSGAYGFSYEQGSQRAANEIALANCISRAHRAGDCRVVEWARGGYCAALVLHHTGNSSVGWGVGSGRSEHDAQRMAWRECQANNEDGCEELAATACSS